ncbi:hypothetical protein TSUD_22330 [Trifolium subterraneum]|uniref:Uncharacterized protein n=1 Tax=Trifolium subterraneum TaxID=3900 RepID=A0A2Z6NPC5_TRISU|nr:hypothetical protein TSUD_22330 [Trifolium subterraneum]
MCDVVKDGDVVVSLNYLNVKSSSDPMLYVEYAVNDSVGRMKSLFWANRNRCNHHSQTIIFCAALVSYERTETYK